jgi:hypothetical protein
VGLVLPRGVRTGAPFAESRGMVSAVRSARSLPLAETVAAEARVRACNRGMMPDRTAADIRAVGGDRCGRCGRDNLGALHACGVRISARVIGECRVVALPNRTRALDAAWRRLARFSEKRWPPRATQAACASAPASSARVWVETVDCRRWRACRLMSPSADSSTGELPCRRE